MATVHTTEQLMIKVKTIRDLASVMLRELRETKRYQDLLVNSDEEGYGAMSAALDDKIVALDYQRDDITDRLGTLALSLWDRHIKVYPDSTNLLQNVAVTVGLSTTLDFTFGSGNLTNIFQNSDQIEIVKAENSDHLGVYTVAAASGTQLTITPTPTTGSAMAVTSINRTSTTATVVTTAVHGLVTGDYVVMAGAGQSEYNGTFQVTVTNTTTFTYTVSGSPATPATGTITVTKAAASNTTDSAMELRLYAR